MNWIKNTLSFLLPENCLSCGKDGISLCEECAAALPRGFSPDGKTAVALEYGDRRVKRSLWLFKYRNRRGLAKTFAGILRDTLAEELSELRQMKNFTAPLLVPMPISARRLRERGYNQAELIAEELSVLFGGELPLLTDVLIKTKHTESQVETKSRKKRLENLRGSFGVSDKAAVRGRNVVLLDDIVTTGATLAEASRALKEAGVKKIFCVALAH